MHVDWMIAEWTASLWDDLGITPGTLAVLLIALYFIMKWAVKNGVKEAIQDMKPKIAERKETEE